MKNVFKIALFICITAHFSAQSQQTALSVVNVVGENLPPFTLPDGSGQQFDVVRAIFEPLNLSVAIEVYPYKRAVALVERGDADMMIGMLKDDNYQLSYSAYPHDVDILIAIFKENNFDNWQGISSLKGKSVTMIAGLSKPFKAYLPEVEFDMSEVGTREQAINKLRHSRTDYMIDSEGSYLTEMTENASAINFVTKPVGVLQIHVAFANTVRGQKLKALWDKHFIDFIQSNKAEKIYRKWHLLREYKNTKRFFAQQLK
ncbi:ABC transporter substrate-binding protein [Thalassotalea sp. PP2-459]|uniref:substrate-binding periplasmic protein n=1 Tax=Thalassotalea sp. PP2-459 TaxID=1742724 RepID=UPI000944E93A|nr:transporter substrate-binding domain-containing protein [Thalassotalea sp. PP2-459]OKY24905.1 hypothetical protein BI291_04915 [Thalassotalea sp. PP2-459]